MKKNLNLKIIVDIVIIILFVCVMNINITGVNIHEYIGLSLFFIIIFHLVLNWNWVKSILKNFSNSNMKFKTKGMFVLNILLFINIFIIILSGIFISQYFFKNISLLNNELVINIHIISSYFLVFLSFIHVGLHFKYLINSFLKIFNTNIKKLFVTISGSVIALIGIYSLVLNSYTKNNNILYVENNTTNNTSVVRKNENDISSSNSNDFEIDDVQETSLNDYLGKLVCTGCHKRCSLLSPQCNKGVTQAQVATQTYNSNY